MFAQFLKTVTRKKNEDGLSLIEVLVATAIFIVVAGITISILNTTLNSTSRFNNVTTTQSAVATAVASMQRDISTSQSILAATSNSITVQLRNGEKDYEVTYFAYDPASDAATPPRTDVSQLPAFNAIIEIRYDVEARTTGQRIVVQGHNPSAYPDENKHHLFDYYNADNQLISASDEIVEPATTPSGIERVEFRISANAEGRGTPIQMESSATSRLGNPTTGVIPYTTTSIPSCPTSLQVRTLRDGANAVTVSWYSPEGATSYTLYRTNLETGNLEDSTIIPNPDTLSLEVEDLTWGVNYSWSIQANGPGGNSPDCAPATAQIVPDKISFVNINSLASNDTSKSGSGAETLTRAAENNLPERNVSTKNILSGNRYTVANGLINQLAWSTGYGVEGYQLYEKEDPTTPVATVTLTGTQWVQVPSQYGESREYYVKAFNDGGESAASESVVLLSPPNASPITAHTPDTSTRSTQTDAVLTVGDVSPNTTGFRMETFTTLASAPQCESVSPTPRLNMNASISGLVTVTDDRGTWGSSNCYRVTPFNDAGEGVSSEVEVNQKPGRFGIKSIVNASSFRIIDETKPLPNPYTCWSDIYGTDANPCDISRPRGYTNYEPIGLFSRSSNTYQATNTTWGESLNASAGYSVNRDLYATMNTVDQPGTQTAVAVYVTGDQSIRYMNEMPGSAFRYTVTATAHNGLSRISDSKQFLTKPDLPRWIGGNYQDRLASGGYETRMYRSVDTNLNRGMGTNIQTYMQVPTYGGMVEQYYTQPVYTGEFRAYSPTQNVRGQNNRWTRTQLEFGGMKADSDVVGRYGLVNVVVCTGECGTWKDWAVNYPTYWSGGPAQVYAGGSATAPNNYTQGNSDEREVSDTVAAPPKAPGIDACAPLVEDSAGFLASSCEYGQGKPPAPGGLSVLSSTDDEYTLTWNAWESITHYEVTVRIDGVTTKTNVPTNRINITIPAGGVASVSVVTVNPTTSSNPSASLNITKPLNVPMGINVPRLTTSTAEITWDSVDRATNYLVSYTVGDETRTVEASNTGVVLTGLESNTSYIVRVAAQNELTTSEESAAIMFTTQP